MSTRVFTQLKKVLLILLTVLLQSCSSNNEEPKNSVYAFLNQRLQLPKNTALEDEYLKSSIKSHLTGISQLKEAVDLLHLDGSESLDPIEYSINCSEEYKTDVLRFELIDVVSVKKMNKIYYMSIRFDENQELFVGFVNAFFQKEKN